MVVDSALASLAVDWTGNYGSEECRFWFDHLERLYPRHILCPVVDETGNRLDLHSGVRELYHGTQGQSATS